MTIRRLLRKFDFFHVLILFSLVGCISSEPRIPVENSKPLKAAFGAPEIVAERYLLLPVLLWEGKSGLYDFSSGSGFAISGSAWSGLGFGKFSGGQALNLDVIDLQEKRHDRVFERQVALGGWDFSFHLRDGMKIFRFDNTLVLTARTTDTNGDQQIDSHDLVMVYAYDLTRHELRRVSPDKYDVENLLVSDNRLVLILAEQGEPRKTAVYLYEPADQKGWFVAEGLKP